MTKKKEEKKTIEFDLGIGKLRLGGIFNGISELIRLADKVSKETGEIKRVGEIKGLPEKVKGIYGFSIRTLVGGKPLIETFGNIKETPKGPVVEEIREPIVDVFDEKDHILVIVELPGISEENVKINLEGDILKLSAENKERKYAKEVLLPSKVKKESMKSSYKNGMLEIKLEKI